MIPKRHKLLPLIFIATCLVLAFLACNKSNYETRDTDFGYDYYPLSTGKYWIYEVDSLVFDPAPGGTSIDSSKTYFKEVVVDTFLNNEGGGLYRIERFTRKNDTLDWKIQSVFSMSIGAREALRTENNLRLIKMTFPLEEGVRWDGNAYIDKTLSVSIAGESLEFFKGWESRALGVGEELSLGNLQFPDVASISIADFENFIEYRYGYEIYARDVGLIFSELRIMDTQCTVCCNGDYDSCSVLPWEEKAEKGFVVRRTLIGYN